MSYTLFTDSGANLTDEIIEKYSIEIVSLKFLVGDTEYQSYTKGQKSDLAPFYEMMRNKVHIKTSLADPHQFKESFEGELKKGNDVLYLGLSSGISGTYQSSVIAAAELREMYPDRKIITIDSLSASLGQGLLMYKAAQLKENGADIDEVATWIEENKLKMCHWFTVEDLFFLMRGGRVSVASATFGEVLSIKPIMRVDDNGKLVVMSKVMGRKKSLNTLIKKFEDEATDHANHTVFIVHGDCEDEALYIKKQIEEKFGVKEVVVGILDPVISSHSGPGTMAIFYLADHR